MALSMSLSVSGSGQRRFTVGSRISATSASATPRAASKRAKVSEMRAPFCSSRTACSSGSRNVQRRPEKDGAKVKDGAKGGAKDGERVSTSILVLPAAVPRLDPAHRARAGAHQDAFRGHELAMEMHALQHRAVGNAGRREH